MLMGTTSRRSETMKKHLSVKSVFFVIVALCSAYPLVMLSCSKVQHFELSRFISPDTCGGCHDEVHGQWKNSMHNLSQVDAIYRAAAFHYLKGLTDADEIAEAESCVKCHTPIGFSPVSEDRVGSATTRRRFGEIAKENTVRFLPFRDGSVRDLQQPVKLDPGHGEADPAQARSFGLVRLPQERVLRLHSSSEMCASAATCATWSSAPKLETTFEEWQKSAYNAPDAKKRVNCQNCRSASVGVPATGSPAAAGRARRPGRARRDLSTHTTSWARTWRSASATTRSGGDGRGAFERGGAFH